MKYYTASPIECELFGFFYKRLEMEFHFNAMIKMRRIFFHKSEFF